LSGKVRELVRENEFCKVVGTLYIALAWSLQMKSDSLDSDDDETGIYK